MRHVTFSEKSLLIGDEAAALLIEYAALLANLRRADTVDLNAIGADGADVVATFLLDAGSPLMTETTNSSMGEPDNAVGIAYIRERMTALTRRTMASVDEDHSPEYFDDLTI
jgi:hypothetical protein